MLVDLKNDLKKGNVPFFPRNPWFGHTNPVLHNESGMNTNSKFTSWTTDRNIAKRFSGRDGVILNIDVPKSKTIKSPDIYYENEVLIQGTVKNAKVTTL